MTTLRLMLRYLPHPKEIILCDVYSKLNYLSETRQKVIHEFGFQGKVHIAPSKLHAPPEIYQATLIIGATSVPDILDIAQLQPGTMIVDDSGPHCFIVNAAIQRFEEHADILFTEGGVLRSPHPIKQLMYLSPDMEEIMRATEMEYLFEPSPFDIMGCVFSSLLSSCFEDLPPTVGIPDTDSCLQHIDVLDQLGFQAADLHCEGYLLPEELIRRFRERFGNQP